MAATAHIHTGPIHMPLSKSACMSASEYVVTPFATSVSWYTFSADLLMVSIVSGVQEASLPVATASFPLLMIHGGGA